ncbi:MAG: hypothetical protein JST23_05360 [Bacteroidetes bacterium]|nr:hypothetical protein [Bacteroidota bacterium]
MATKGNSWEGYVLFLIPLSGLMLLIGGLNNGNYPLGRSLWTILPLLGILFMIIGEPIIQGQGISDVFSALGKGYGIGLWLSIIAAIAALAYTPKE